MNMCVDSLKNSLLIFVKTMYIAINFAQKMFCKPNNLTGSFIPLNWLYMP